MSPTIAWLIFSIGCATIFGAAVYLIDQHFRPQHEALARQREAIGAAYVARVDADIARRRAEQEQP